MRAAQHRPGHSAQSGALGGGAGTLAMDGIGLEMYPRRVSDHRRRDGEIARQQLRRQRPGTTGGEQQIEATGVSHDLGSCRGPLLADRLAERLAERGHTVAPRAHTTLVSWEDEDPEATRDRLVVVGVIVRNLPGRPLLRASVGAWSSDEDLERLLDAL